MWPSMPCKHIHSSSGEEWDGLLLLGGINWPDSLGWFLSAWLISIHSTTPTHHKSTVLTEQCYGYYHNINPVHQPSLSVEPYMR